MNGAKVGAQGAPKTVHVSKTVISTPVARFKAEMFCTWLNCLVLRN
jgi:hypothetical protein